MTSLITFSLIIMEGGASVIMVSVFLFEIIDKYLFDTRALLNQIIGNRWQRCLNDNSITIFYEIINIYLFSLITYNNIAGDCRWRSIFFVHHLLSLLIIYHFWKRFQKFASRPSIAWDKENVKVAQTCFGSYHPNFVQIMAFF